GFFLPVFSDLARGAVPLFAGAIPMARFARVRTPNPAGPPGICLTPATRFQLGAAMSTWTQGRPALNSRRNNPAVMALASAPGELLRSAMVLSSWVSYSGKVGISQTLSPAAAAAFTRRAVKPGR